MRAIITGASGGIGAACARELAKTCAAVGLGYNSDRKSAYDLAEETGGVPLRFDVADPEAVDEAFGAFGEADALILSAGTALWKLVQDTTYEEWRRIFAVNVDGVFNVTRRAVPHMIGARWGRIVIISSMWGIRGASCETAYSATKAALIGYTKALAKELGPSGITVNCIAPGVIDTRMNDNLTPEALDALRDDTPVGRLGTPEDVAKLAAFLVTPEASFITGQIISVDGGFAV